jgi:hypothetical protein
MVWLVRQLRQHSPRYHPSRLHQHHLSLGDTAPLTGVTGDKGRTGERSLVTEVSLVSTWKRQHDWRHRCDQGTLAGLTSVTS